MTDGYVFTEEQLIMVARDLVERVGASDIQLEDVAAILNVAVSVIHEHFPDRWALLAALNTYNNHEFLAAITQATGTTANPRERLLRLCQAYRSHANRYPNNYIFGFFHQTDNALRLQSMFTAPVVAFADSIVGEDNGAPMLGGLWALVHGFVLLENTGRLDGLDNLDRYFERSVEAFLAGWSA